MEWLGVGVAVGPGVGVGAGIVSQVSLKDQLLS